MGPLCNGEEYGGYDGHRSGVSRARHPVGLYVISSSLQISLLGPKPICAAITFEHDSTTEGRALPATPMGLRSNTQNCNISFKKLAAVVLLMHLDDGT